MHLTPVNFIIVLPIVFLAGLIDAIAGGGGLISLPAYLFAGLPPHLALGTNKFSSVWGTLVATANYWRNRLMDTKVAVVSAVGALLGSWIGARLVLLISPGFLNYLLVILIPIIAIFTILNQKMGMQNLSHGVQARHKLILGFLAGLIIGCYDGFFGPGTGTFLILFYTILLKYDFVTANANTKVVNLASNIAAVLTFALSGHVLFTLAIPAAACGILGNLLGSRMVVLKGSRLIRPIFIIALCLLMIRVVWNLFK